MNIFILDQNHTKCAQAHVDKHVGKQLLEATQLMCTQFQLQNIEAPYKPTHRNHPCSIFCRQSLDNFMWVYDYALSLNVEFTYRYNKQHKSGLILPWIIDNIHKLEFPKLGRTPFALAMPDQYKSDDAVISYRKYYNGDKTHLFKWTNRNNPEWVILNS